jgi:protein MpaA
LKKNFYLILYILVVSFAINGLLRTTARAQNAESETNKAAKVKLCHEVNDRFKKFKWNKIVCNPDTWTFEEKYASSRGRPLFFREFIPQVTESTTLVMCGIHGNELSSVYLCINLAREMIYDNPAAFNKSHVIIAPLVNPDGFLSSPPTRHNGHGIDLNRNFPTKDFEEKALVQWRKHTKSDKGKYPGEKGGSEIETQFQMMLIERFKPDKIISIHAPYGWIDFDLPDMNQTGDEPDGFDFKDMQSKAKEIAIMMSRKSKDFRMKTFGVFPGSLGNYAAKEQGIPVYTLELPSSDPSRGEEYWAQMKNAVIAAIQYKLVKISKR